MSDQDWGDLPDGHFHATPGQASTVRPGALASERLTEPQGPRFRRSIPEDARTSLLNGKTGLLAPRLHSAGSRAWAWAHSLPVVHPLYAVDAAQPVAGAWICRSRFARLCCVCLLFGALESGLLSRPGYGTQWEGAAACAKDMGAPLTWNAAPRMPVAEVPSRLPTRLRRSVWRPGEQPATGCLPLHCIAGTGAGACVHASYGASFMPYSFRSSVRECLPIMAGLAQGWLLLCAFVSLERTPGARNGTERRSYAAQVAT
jgi:hypothetical protein